MIPGEPANLGEALNGQDIAKTFSVWTYILSNEVLRWALLLAVVDDTVVTFGRLFLIVFISHTVTSLSLVKETLRVPLRFTVTLGGATGPIIHSLWNLLREFIIIT